MHRRVNFGLSLASVAFQQQTFTRLMEACRSLILRVDDRSGVQKGMGRSDGTAHSRFLEVRHGARIEEAADGAD